MTVKMTKDGKSADVHPDEVSNYTLYGWEAEKGSKKSAKKVPTETLYDVYKITDGEKGKRPSKANVTEAEAKEWMSGRDEDYEMVVSD